MHTLGHRLRSAVDSFWFIPALLLVAAVVLAEAVVALDTSFVGQGIAELPFVNGVGASGSRDLLSAIGGSMLGVAATSFSITISVIATASSTYGPRLVRNFMADRGNQIVLGIYGATFLYALMVLRTIREANQDRPEFVPHLAVTLGIVLAVLDVAVLIYFIHHIADSIQVPTLASQVLRDLQRSRAVDRSVPTRTVDPTALPGVVALTVRADRHGFLQFVDHTALVAWAVDHDAVVEVRPRVGDHVIHHDPIVLVRTTSGGDLSAGERRLRRALVFGPARTSEQDLRYAVRQLAELAVRALSASTNDPYTATNAVLEIGTGLSPLVGADDPGNAFERDGQVRLVHTLPSVLDLLDVVFDDIRPHVGGSTEVVLALLDLVRILTAHTERVDVIDRLAEHEAAVLRTFTGSGPDPRDARRVEARAAGGVA